MAAVTLGVIAVGATGHSVNQQRKEAKRARKDAKQAQEKALIDEAAAKKQSNENAESRRRRLITVQASSGRKSTFASETQTFGGG